MGYRLIYNMGIDVYKYGYKLICNTYRYYPISILVSVWVSRTN